jgi:hypothetical protein
VTAPPVECLARNPYIFLRQVANAAIVYMMDVLEGHCEEQKKVIRPESFRARLARLKPQRFEPFRATEAFGKLAALVTSAEISARALLARGTGETPGIR